MAYWVCWEFLNSKSGSLNILFAIRQISVDLIFKLFLLCSYQKRGIYSMASYQHPHKNNQSKFYGEGISRVMTLKEAGFPMGRIPMLNVGVPAGKPLEKSSDEHTNALFPFNFFPKSSDGYVIHVSGDSMTGAGISDGDLLLVNKSASPENRDIVVASINGEMTVKRYINHGDRIVFAPENKNYDPIIATSKDDVDIFGVVVRIIKEPN
jgi:DNA polymerase V